MDSTNPNAETSSESQPSHRKKKKKYYRKTKKIFPAWILGMIVVVTAIVPLGLANNRKIVLAYHVLTLFPDTFMIAAIAIWGIGLVTVVLSLVFRNKSHSSTYSMLGIIGLLAFVYPYVDVFRLAFQDNVPEALSFFMKTEVGRKTIFAVIVTVNSLVSMLATLVLTHFRLRIKQEGRHNMLMIMALIAFLSLMALRILRLLDWDLFVESLKTTPVIGSLGLLCSLLFVVAFFLIFLFGLGKAGLSFGKYGLCIIYGTIALQIMVFLGQYIHLGYRMEQYGFLAPFPMLAIFHPIVTFLCTLCLGCMGTIRWMHERHSGDDLLYVDPEIALKLRNAREEQDEQSEAFSV